MTQYVSEQKHSDILIQGGTKGSSCLLVWAGLSRGCERLMPHNPLRPLCHIAPGHVNLSPSRLHPGISYHCSKINHTFSLHTKICHFSLTCLATIHQKLFIQLFPHNFGNTWVWLFTEDAHFVFNLCSSKLMVN